MNTVCRAKKVILNIFAAMICFSIVVGTVFILCKFAEFMDHQNKPGYYCKVVIEDKVMFEGECFYETNMYSRGNTNYVKLYDKNYAEHLFTSNKSILFSKSTLTK